MIVPPAAVELRTSGFAGLRGTFASSIYLLAVSDASPLLVYMLSEMLIL